MLARFLFIFSCCYVILCTEVSAQLFKGVPPSDWVLVEGNATILCPDGVEVDKKRLSDMARRQAIENRMGTSIVYGNFIKSYETELDNYEHFVDMSSQFPQGVWRADVSEPEYCREETEIRKENSAGIIRKRVKAEKWSCRVKGYAQPLKQIMPQFEFQIMNGNNSVIVEQTMQDGKAVLSVGTDSVFRQGDLFRTRFRCTCSGHLVLFMDNGQNAFRMLPYAAFDKDDDVFIEAGKWYSFFDSSAVPYNERCNVDELELLTDMEFDAIRIYYLFSETPFNRDFFFSIVDSGNEIPEGYSQLPSITSIQFAGWLQQNKVLKPDLQISVVDLVIDNVNKTGDK